MRLCRIAGVDIRFDIPALILFTLCVLAGICKNLPLLFFSLTLHELAHTLMAYRLGYTVKSISVQPFGFVARLEGDVNEWDALCIAAVGPLCSLVAGAVCFALKNMNIDGAFLADFGNANLMIGLVNLLPAFPLDGGRILRACLFRVLKEAYRIAAWIGVCIAVIFFALGVMLLWENNITMLFMGAFLLPAAIMELREATHGKSRALIQRTIRMRRGEALRVRYLAVNESMRAGDAYKLTTGANYTLLHVVDDTMRSRGVIDEGALLRLIAAHGTEEPLRAFVDRDSLT